MAQQGVLTGKSGRPEGIRIVCINDTHAKHQHIDRVPDGDVLIHAGDFSNTGTLHELEIFRDFINDLPHRKKIVISGNHDTTLHAECYIDRGAARFHSRSEPCVDLLNRHMVQRVLN